MSKKRSIIVHLSGGLGNQLFQFMAGLTLSRLTEKKLVINVNLYKNPTLRNRNHPNYAHKRKLELSEFKDLAGIGVDRTPTPRDGRFERVLSHLPEEYKRKMGIATNESYKNGTWLKPQNIERLVGFFMSPNYFKDVLLVGKFQELNHPLHEWSQRLISEITSQNSICVHIRLTDYLSQNHIVIPGENYYIGAINYLLQKIGRNTRVYIFTDDPKSLQIRFPRIYSLGSCVNPPSNISIAENLLLMSKCSAFVCSNSTFSWWAAQISGVPKEKIIHPSEFYRQDQKINLALDLWDANSLMFDPDKGNIIRKSQ